MSAISPLTPDLVREALQAAGWEATDEKGGDFRIVLPRDGAKEIKVHIDGGALADGTFSLQASRAIFFQPTEGAKAIEFCNRWNRLYRLPRAYTIEVGKMGNTAILLDQTMLCQSGTHAPAITDTVNVFIEGVLDFWDTADAVLLEEVPSIQMEG